MPRSTAEASLSMGALRERWMPLRVAPGDGERADALGLQFGSESREIRVAHGCSFGRVLDGSERRGYPREACAGQAIRSTTLPKRPGSVRRRAATAMSSSGCTESIAGRQAAESRCAQSARNSRGLPMVVPTSERHCQ